jgi:transposase
MRGGCASPTVSWLPLDTLGHMYVEFTVSESLQALVDCHRHAFEYFVGFTNTILYDNMPTVVDVQAC